MVLHALLSVLSLRMVRCLLLWWQSVWVLFVDVDDVVFRSERMTRIEEALLLESEYGLPIQAMAQHGWRRPYLLCWTVLSTPWLTWHARIVWGDSEPRGETYISLRGEPVPPIAALDTWHREDR